MIMDNIRCRDLLCVVVSAERVLVAETRNGDGEARFIVGQLLLRPTDSRRTSDINDRGEAQHEIRAWRRRSETAREAGSVAGSFCLHCGWSYGDSDSESIVD